MRRTGHIFYRMSPSLGLSNVSFMVTLGLWVLGKNTIEVECLPIPSYQAILLSTGLITGNVNLDLLVKVTSVRFLGPHFGSLVKSVAIN